MKIPKHLKFLLLSIASGLLFAAAWPTYGFPLLLFFAFVPLLYLETLLRTDRYHKSLVFGYAYLAFFIWNICTVGWLSNLPQAYVVWFASGVNALLMTLVFLCYHVVSRKTTFSLASLFLVCLWISFEYFHLYWDFSFPWLNLGNGFSGFTSWIQWYEYTGTFGGTLWVWLVNIGIFKSVLLYLEHKERTIIYRGVLRNCLMILLPIGISLLLLKTYEETGSNVEVVVLQPNIDSYVEKYSLKNDQIAALLKELTDSTATENTNFIIAPETVFADTRLRQFSYSTAKRSTTQLIEYYPKASFLGGISLNNVFKDASKIHKQTNIIRDSIFVDDYNSAFFVRQNGSDEMYHKTRLVVGVENFPYKNILQPILGDAMLDLGGTVLTKTTQEDREVFYTEDGLGVGPIICYESIYGEFVAGYVRNGAGFLSIITNDSWWGNSEGHRQHLSFAQMRAIETRRSIARSANTGISAIINQKGELVQQLGYDQKGAIKGSLTTNDSVTFYVRFGDYIARISVFLGILVLLYVFTRRRGEVGK